MINTCRVYGPFGPKQTSKTITIPFDTEAELIEYLKTTKTLEVIVRVNCGE